MNERSRLIRETVLILFQKKQSGKLITRDQLDELFNCGILSDKSALRYIVKSEYAQMIKSSDISLRSAVIDLTIKWDVSEWFVTNLIYKTPHIKV